MTTSPNTGTLQLVDRSPRLTGAELTASLVPPPQFREASFDSYRPDDDYPSQAEAVEALRAFAGGGAQERRGLFRRRRGDAPLPGVYLDGGFGVGKTHLLASLWHAVGGRRRYFGTFIQYTALVGALGYREAVDALRGAELICIDEFELDDPGDTMVMTRMLGELMASGTRVAATSNTPPNALGEGRFAAQDFLREIQAMSDRFRTLRIDGLDFRRRSNDGVAVATEPERYEAALSAAAAGGARSDDAFADLVAHLASVHPSAYVRLVDGLGAIGLRDVRPLAGQTEALRLVALVDRIYDAQVPIVATGVPLDTVFGDDMLAGGYRKKYQRAMSRIVALTTPAAAGNEDVTPGENA